jgi:glycosyltransferase involved in cell wall biosynthesis
MSAPLVSIVIATYRSRHDHLRVAIGSALAQTMADIEVIVSDDSPDDALSGLVASFHDERLRYRHNAPALGVARNHWVSFGEARGEFIVILNHDDWLAPTLVERLASALQAEPQAVLAFCDHWVIDAEGERLASDTERNTAAWGRALLGRGLHRSFAPLVAAQTIPMAMGAMFRCATLPAVMPDDAGPAYDLWLAYLLCRTGGGAWYEIERLSAWRSHADNLTSGAGLPWLHGSALCWQAMSLDPLFAPLHRLIRRKAALGFYGCALRAWTDGQRLACAIFALRSLRAQLTLRGLLACLLPALPTNLSAMRPSGRRSV